MTVTLRAGELEELGFEEPEPGCVPDSFENRQRISRLEGNWQFERVLNDRGIPTGLIRPLSPAMLAERRADSYSMYKHLLVDQSDPWSNYIGPDDLTADTYAPQWILLKLQSWRRHEREGTLPKWTFPVRCDARRSDGTRCWLWSASQEEGLKLCKSHRAVAGNDPQEMLTYGRNKVISMLPNAIDRLEYLAFNAESEPVSLKATETILATAGLRPGMEIEVSGGLEVSNPTDQVLDKITTLQDRLLKAQKELEQAQSPDPTTIQDAEVVTDDTP